MLFYTWPFVIMFIILLTALSTTNSDGKKKLFLLLASYLFYMWWNPAFILLIIFSTVLDYVVGHLLSGEQGQKRRKLYLILSLTGNLGMLGIFKYFNFFQDNLFLFLRCFGYTPSWTALNIILPVGISFYTFQTMSYTIDVYRRAMEPTKSALDFSLFVAFFPQLVAGPIVRASDFLPQLKKPTSLYFGTDAFFLILRGLIKKVIIADNLSGFVDPIFAAPDTWPGAVLLLATISFSIQIYCDFSGYSDMAIGIARTLGYELPLNFNKPYFARNPSDFWKRWHISLSTWLRDYLYISLGGNRSGAWKTYRNLMLTMLLGGLWHGASWNFVLWGAMHGCALILHRTFSAFRKKYLKAAAFFSSRVWSVCSWAVMQYFILLSWVAFRLRDTDDMLYVLRKLLSVDSGLSLKDIGLGSLSIFSTLALLSLFGILHAYAFRFGELDKTLAKKPLIIGCAACFLIGLGFVLLWPSDAPPFIYFQF